MASKRRNPLTDNESQILDRDTCLNSRSPHAPAFLRKAARVADRLGATWYAVYIQRRASRPKHVDAATQCQIGNNLDLARQLGSTSPAF
jgi:two-component system sensor histidine kinase KdpD